MDEVLATMQPSLRLVQRGDFIHRAGDPYVGLSIVSTGCLKSVLPTADGDEHIVAFHQTGSVAGLSGIATGRYANDVIAVCTGAVCHLPSAEIEQMRQRDADFASVLLNWTTTALQRTQRLNTTLTSMSAVGRFATFLLDMARAEEIDTNGTCNFALPMTRAEIGRYLALAPETVSRMVDTLKKANLVRLQRHDVEYMDRGGLAQVARSGSVERRRTQRAESIAAVA